MENNATNQAIEGFKKDISKFVKTFFGVELQPWQIEVMQSLKDNADRKVTFKFKLPKKEAAKLNGLEHPFIIVDDEVPEEIYESVSINHHAASNNGLPSDSSQARTVVTDDPSREGRGQ